MAKIRVRSAGWRGFKHSLSIRAGFGKRGPGFESCITMGIGKRQIHACGNASNPRAALADALQRAGAQVRKRSGAFAGFAGYSKTNRKSRRTRRASKRS